MTRIQVLCATFVVLLFSTFFLEIADADSIKKKIILKGLVGAGLLLKYLKPKKGILPIPLPLPLPLPIEWEQPPVVVHNKQHPVPIPHPVPVPVQVPIHVPIIVEKPVYRRPPAPRATPAPKPTVVQHEVKHTLPEPVPQKSSKNIRKTIRINLNIGPKLTPSIYETSDRSSYYSSK